MTRGNEHCTRTVTKLQRTLDTGQWTLGQSLKIVWKVEVYMRKYVVAVWQWHGWRWMFDPTSRCGQSCRKFSALNCPSPSEINQSNSISFGNYQVNLFGALPTRRSGFLENPTFLRSYLQLKSCSLKILKQILKNGHMLNKKRESHNVLRQVKFPVFLENQTNYESCLILFQHVWSIKYQKTRLYF